MMDAGAALVIGNQAHWVQAVEEFPNVAHGIAVIRYSFCLPSTIRYDTL